MAIPIFHIRRFHAGCLFVLLALGFIPAAGESFGPSLPVEDIPGQTREVAAETGATSETVGEEENVQNPRDPVGDDYGSKADDFHKIVSERLTASANWLDSFFRDERTEIEDNETSLRVRLSSFLEDGKGLDADAKLRLRLVLPELEDRFHLMITGERDEEDDFSDAPVVIKKGEFDPEADRNVTLSLRYFIKKARNRNLSFKVGARLNGFPAVFYAGPRFRISKKFKPWVVRFTQEVKYFTDDGWETTSRFDFEKPLSDALFFRTRTEGSWYENEVGYYYDVNFILYQVIDKDRALEYAWNNYFETRPSDRLDQIHLHVTYRQRFWRPWLFFEIEPQLAFRKDQEFVPTPGITFAVEAFFGEKK
ncbi:MAG: hypothetical protein AB1724_00135 [Thermodesulfobacteriota bacterium]